jgi:putative hydrolase of the HAD superfamily
MYYHDIAAVLFDLDGTLIEHTRTLDDLCRETFEAFGDKLTQATAARFWEAFWPRNHDLWYMMVDGVLPGDVARLYSFVNALRALQADVGLAEAMLQDWELRIIDATRLFADALPTIERMREADLCLGIVTNGFATMQRRKIRRHCLEEQVDFIIVSEELGVFKPEQAIFEAALAQAGVAAQQALFVGDTPISDIQGARNAGLHAALMDPRATWADVELDGVARLGRLGELLPLLGLNGRHPDAPARKL